MGMVLRAFARPGRAWSALTVRHAPGRRRLRVPDPPAGLAGAAASTRDLGRSVSFFPLVGLVIGLVLTGVASRSTGGCRRCVLAVLVAALAADADRRPSPGRLRRPVRRARGRAGGSGPDAGDHAGQPDRRRTGAAALVLLLLAKVAALTQLVSSGTICWRCWRFPPSRAGLVAPLMVCSPTPGPRGWGGRSRARRARPGARSRPRSGGRGGRGAGRALRRFRRWAPWPPPCLLAFWLMRRLGGLTGDVYGAAIELAEVTRPRSLSTAPPSAST